MYHNEAHNVKTKAHANARTQEDWPWKWKYMKISRHSDVTTFLIDWQNTPLK